MKHFLLPMLLCLAGCATTPPAPPPPAAPPVTLDAPLVDYHQHLVSPAFAPIAKLPERDGAKLLAEMDAAGVRRAVVLSVGYTYADERKKLDDPDRLTREENDWTSAQVAASGGRLIGFCSANPLREAALAELERCLALPGMVGIKLHFGNAGISLRNPAHADRMAEVFALGNRLRAPILSHLRARGGADFGAPDASLFLDRLAARAPDVDLIVAHLGASSPGYPDQNDQVMAVFGEAAERRDPRMRRVYFDAAANVTAGFTPADGARVARRVRQIGAGKFVYGSDLSPPGGSIRSGWDIFRAKVPLTPAEMQAIAGNLLPFVR